MLLRSGPVIEPQNTYLIGHLWDELERRVRRRQNIPTTLAQLRNALLEDWNISPVRRINAFMNTMQR